MQIKRCITGATNGHLSPRDAGGLPIPLIEDIVKQKEIAVNIQKIRDRAKQLEEEAVSEINKAKAQVERLLLGDL